MAWQGGSPGCPINDAVIPAFQVRIASLFDGNLTWKVRLKPCKGQWWG